MGRIACTLRILRSKLVTSLLKKGDPPFPSNYRPITLLSVLCKFISIAIYDFIGDLNGFRSKQWRFIQGSNTQNAAAYAPQSLRQGFCNAAFLDLRGAYDLVHRENLLDIRPAQVPDGTSWVLPALLVPVGIKASRQVSGAVAVIVMGVA